jgi:hypothetical protein
MKTIILIVAALVTAAVASYVGFGIGYKRGVAHAFDAKNYDYYRELAFDAQSVARGREDIFFRGVDSVMMNYPDLLQIETRLGVSDEQRKVTENLIIQYFYSQNRPIPQKLAPFFGEIPSKDTFIFTRLPNRDEIQRLRSDQK